MDTYLKKAISLTIEKQSFNEMTMSELEFAALLKECFALIKSMKSDGGDELCEEFMTALGGNEEWESAYQLFDSLLYDD